MQCNIGIITVKYNNAISRYTFNGHGRRPQRLVVKQVVRANEVSQFHQQT